MGRINNFLRVIINGHNKIRLKNKNFTLIANNCNGSLICHDLGIRYNSPFVNLYLEPKEFIKYLSNMEYYNNCDIKFIKEKDRDYPVGILDDIKIYFVHYNTNKEAEEKWNERKSRINLENLFVLMAERDECTMEDLIAFDNLAYENKIVFTHLPYDNIKSSFYIKGFENDKQVGECFRFKN